MQIQRIDIVCKKVIAKKQWARNHVKVIKINCATKVFHETGHMILKD